MAATFNWCEDNGALNAGHGTTRTGFSATSPVPADVNWKVADDARTDTGVGTLYSASPITAGNNSSTKYQYGRFSGTFNQISAGLWAHTAGTFGGTGTGGTSGTGFTLKGVVTSTYAQPTTAANAALTVDMTNITAIGSGQTVLFHTTGPEGAGPTATLSAAGYTQYLATQLQVASTAGAGDTGTITLTLQYNEN